ncbi:MULTISPECIES: hypothetical protein [Rhodococcus]|uniref:hypothetical protein n=1 Tax=Rhodococcus sp. TaxID=1831 RepID=UPI0012188E71|nr:hypothetical protein [Rhodococcus sp. (in: high G+C Gram-positive bacteria)]RZL24910.1 MAG: hypothetical protein EOP31_11405 [Rhodococcus sp. (in: high G+C Gram-positive bacteria)]
MQSQRQPALVETPLYVADTLALGNHHAVAIAHRTQVLQHHGSVVRAARLAALLTRRVGSAPAARAPVGA